MEVNYTWRHRVNASISVKGVTTWDCTVEGLDKSIEEVLAEHDKLVFEMRKRYPIEEGK